MHTNQHVYITKLQLLKTNGIPDYFNLCLTELMKSITDPLVKDHSTCMSKIRVWNLSCKRKGMITAQAQL